MRKPALLLSIAMLATLAPVGAALARPAARAAIVGGGPAAPGTWPWAAFVADFQGDQGMLCTGTVVAPRVVLTAGHCVTDASAGDYRVLTGSLDVSNESAGHVSDVTQTATFPYWNPQNRFGDAALLILATPTTAPAIPLATLDDVALLRPGHRAPIAGWGQTRADDQNPPTQLRTGTLVLQDSSYCGERSADLQTAFQPAAMVCAIDSRDFNVGACHGDSGGPLLGTRSDGTPVEIGIASAVANGCFVKFPVFYTRVDLVSNWVNAWINAAAAAGSGPVTPPTTLPPATNATPPLGRLSPAEVAGEVRRAIAARMGSRFRGAAGYRTRCARQSASSVKCNVKWTRLGTHYAGVVTIFLRYDKVQRLIVADSKATFRKR